MSGSQKTFETRIGRYKNADTLIQSWADYKPSSELLSKKSNTAFIASVEKANNSVITKKQPVDEQKAARKLLCFTEALTNPNCAEERIARVLSYLSGELEEGNTTVHAIRAILKKIRPNYPGAASKRVFKIAPNSFLNIPNVAANSAAKNTGDTDLSWAEETTGQPAEIIHPAQTATIAPHGGTITIKNLSADKKGKIQLTINTGKEVLPSRMEKTYASIPGLLTDVISHIEGLNPSFSYNPPDDKLTTAELKKLKAEIEKLNSQLSASMDVYGTAHRDRKKLYDGTIGMSERIRLIKSYLGSFTGGKKSEHYIEFSQAIKGT
ncbi:MAG: hypothetical protein HY841_08350 [Bacteroidetes bacterium]|nr:hypothetical protein [Bacteroidota bacterium]